MINKINLWSTFLICLMSSWNLSAQQGILKLTLQEAIDLGLKNRTEIKNQELTQRLAANEVNKIKSKNLPQINATFDGRVNTQLQTQVLSPQATGGASTDPIKFKFGTNYYNVFAINATQNIFSPSIQGDRKINAARTELEMTNFEKIRIDVKVSIVEAYYDALLKREKADLSGYNLKQSHEFFLQGQGQLKNGTILQTDQDLLELNEMNALNSNEIDHRTFQLSLTNLLYKLGLRGGDSLELTEPISITDNPSRDAISNFTVTNRIELRQERSQMLVNELNLKKHGVGYWPTISLYGNYTLQQFNNSFDPANGQLWNPFNYFGLKVELPIFDGFTKERNRAEFQYRIEQNKNNLNRLEGDLDFELQSASSELTSSITNLAYSKRGYELAKKIMDAGRVRYREGTITSAEMRNLEYSLRNAQTNYLDSLYNYFIARIRFMKAQGEL